jgi:hypothetical protein
MQQALEALEHLHRTGDTQVFDLCYAPEVIPALRAALAQPEYPQGQASTDVGVPVYVVKKAEPVAWMQEMPVSGNEERSVRMTTVKMVADGWENPIPLFTQPAQALAEPEQSVEQALEALNKMQSIGLMMADGRHPRDVLRSFIHGAAPTPRKPLTDDEIQHCADEAGLTMTKRLRCFARAIERAHGIKEQEP